MRTAPATDDRHAKTKGDTGGNRPTDENVLLDIHGLYSLRQTMEETPDLGSLAMMPFDWAAGLLSGYEAPGGDEVLKRTYLMLAGCLRRFQGAVRLLEAGYIEDAVIVTRPLQEDAARLVYIAKRPKEARLSCFLYLWNRTQRWRDEMLKGLERDDRLAPAGPLIEMRRRQLKDEQRAFSRLQARSGLPTGKVPKDGDLVSILGPMERSSWASASISSHTTWSPYQQLHVSRRDSGRTEIDLAPKASPRIVGVMLHEFGRWLFRAAEAFETIFGIEPGGTESQFKEWHEALESTIGVKTVDELVAESGDRTKVTTREGYTLQGLLSAGVSMVSSVLRRWVSVSLASHQPSAWTCPSLRSTSGP